MSEHRSLSSSDEVPDGFFQLKKDIQEAFSQRNKEDLQEQVLKESLIYIHKNHPKHWFCNEYMSPIVMYLMISFSFPENDVSDWIRYRIEENCHDCPPCTVEYHKMKIKLGRLLSKTISMRKINRFMDVVSKWESDSSEITLREFLKDSTKSNTEFVNLPPKIQHAIMTGLLNPDVLRVNSDLSLHLKLVFQNDLHQPLLNLLVPGIIYFLFEGDYIQKLWASAACKFIKDTPITNRDFDSLSLVLQEFEYWHYKIQDSTYFSPANCIQFWDVFLQLEGCIDDNTLTGLMNSPPDIRQTGIEYKRELYPLCTMFLQNHLMRNIRGFLPVGLKVLSMYLRRLNDEFWKLAPLIKSSKVLDRILDNYDFPQYLISKKVLIP